MDLNHDLVDVTEIFHKNTSLSVPKYQRGYSWSDENFSDLWEDIKERILDSDENHFFGTIILADKESRSDKQLEIIDGQQRATTFTIIFRVMYDLCSEDNGIKKQIYKKIISKDGGKTYKLTLGDVDEGFFEEYIKRPVAGRTKKGKLTSHKKIRECYEYFKKQILEYAEVNEKNIDEVVNDLFDKFESDTHFLLLKVASDVDAYTIFESINAKRVDLTPAELIKNYVFSVSDKKSSAKLKEAENNWLEIQNNFEEFEVRPEITEFIRYYWISSRADVNQKQLYKELKNNLKRDADKVSSLLDNLASESFDYAALNNPAGSISKHGIKLLTAQELNVLNVRQAHPVLLSLLSQKIDQETFDAIVTKIISLFIRRSIKGSNPNEIEKEFGTVARNIRKNLETGIENLHTSIKTLMPSNEEIITGITTSIKTPNVRFILEHYEISMSAKGGKKIDTPTLEHIMPQQPEIYADWNADEESHERWVNNIGNLTLLEKPINSSVKNKKYEIKREEYINKFTDMNITKYICDNYQVWNIDMIKHRAATIADFTVNKWPE